MAPTTRTYDLGSDTTYQTMCLTNPSKDQLVEDEGAQIFYSIQSQTKPIGIGANCEISHKRYKAQWVNMARMTASKSIGIARREVTRTKDQRTRWAGTFAKPMSKPMGK